MVIEQMLDDSFPNAGLRQDDNRNNDWVSLRNHTPFQSSLASTTEVSICR